MRCQRCKGIMVREKFLDTLDDTGKYGLHGWHCVICGEVTDPIIQEHRKTPIRPIKSRNRKLIFGVN